MTEKGKTYKKIYSEGEVRTRSRYVLEKAGVLVGDGLVVHHKDGNRLNDDISNLEILTPVDHQRLHNLKRPSAKIPDDRELAWCSRCRKFRSVKDFCKREGRWNGLQKWCKHCKAGYNRLWRAKKLEGRIYVGY